MTPKTEMSVLLLICGLQSYGQQVEPRLAAEAKAAAGREARADAAVVQIPPPTATGAFVTFDVPGAGNASPASINNAGAITGSYADNVGSGQHGFLRAPNGAFVTFDIPNAVFGTLPSSINNAGAITGQYGDNIGLGAHGFIRATNGAIVTFDVPGGALFFQTGVINPEGAVAGSYFDANFLPHSFLRAPNGAFTTIDHPGAVNGTFPSAITANGVILGVYSDANSSHGFLRDPSGAFTEIDVPGGGGAGQDPFNFGPALSIAPQGVITGTYFATIAGNPFGGNYRVFVRSADGEYITFDAANYPPCCLWSAPSGINPAGTITGSFNDGFGVNHGFLRTRDGKVTTFDAPGAGTGFPGNQGTAPLGITPGGVIMGLYRDAKDVSHGFLFLPQ